MPQWIDLCVERYKKKGLSEDEAWKRCMGAHKKRQNNNKKKRRASTNNNT